MTKTLLVPALVALGLLAEGGVASAQTYYDYPWCAAYSPSTKNCGFKTFEQCLATISGVGGICEQNPWYRPRSTAPRKATRN